MRHFFRPLRTRTSMLPMAGRAGQPQGWPVSFVAGFPPPLSGPPPLMWK
ncbi:MAG: ash family protein [Cupriavidus sp.]|nr:ash family protein [Cupriavidus sp.]